MTRRLPLLVALVLLAAAPAAARPWPFPEHLRDRLVWVHPLANYAYAPAWQRDWERALARDDGLRTTIGSVSTDDLLLRLELNLNRPLSGPWRFVARLDRRDALHVDRPRDELWLGFAAELVRGLEVEVQTDPAGPKEELDLRAGVLLTDAARTRYLRLALRWDDPLYGEKNDRGGAADATAAGPQWEARWAAGRWEAFSRGRYLSRWSRAFPDSATSPAVRAEAGRHGEGVLRVRRLLADGELVEAGLAHYRFTADEVRRDGADGYAYRHEWVHAHALAELAAGPRLVLRPELHWVRQWASGRGARAFAHTREDVIPALSVRLATGGRGAWELGYMGTHHRWEHTAGRQDAWTDKVKLGWLFAFTPRARLQASLSHELDLERFGGGNVQFQVLF